MSAATTTPNESVVNHTVYAPTAHPFPPTPPVDSEDTIASEYTTPDGALFVLESHSKISGSTGQIVVGCRTTQKDKLFHNKMERLKGMDAQGLAMKYAAAKGLSSPSFSQLAQTMATNAQMVPIHVARAQGQDDAPGGFVCVFRVNSSNRGGA
jgi:hypothetical protein